METFNTYELENWPIPSNDYVCHALVHLIDDNDVINAKFVLQRAQQANVDDIVLIVVIKKLIDSL